MKKFYIVAALLMATTSAHAGTVSFEVEGKRVSIEMPSDCRSVSCLKITAPGISGEAKRSDDDDNAGPNSRRFNDDDRASGPGRPGLNGGRRFNDDDRFAGRPGRPDFKGGRRFSDEDDSAGRRGRPDFQRDRRSNDDDDFASRRERPDFKGDRRFNDEDDSAGRSGRPDLQRDRRSNDDNDFASRRGHPDFKGGRRFNDDDAQASNGPERPRFKGGYKSKRYNDDDNYVAKPDSAPAIPAAPAPAAAADNAAPAAAQADAVPLAPAPAQVATATPERQPAPVAAAPESDPNSPLGVWATEENKGNVRIEQCGDDLCGYSEKTGEKILINMRPQGSKWAGRINDPDSGRKYDSTMAMKGTNTLRVQGCAFGGMFCGGQTWKRVS